MAVTLPSLSLLAAVLLAAVPWGLPAQAAFVPPLIALTLVFVHSSKADRHLPCWLVFAAGLLTDSLTGGPLGYWALLFLLTQVLAMLFVRRRTPSRIAVWSSFAATLAIVMAVGWTLASLYFMRFADWAPMAVGVAAALALFPVLSRRPPAAGGASWRRSHA